MYTTGIKLLNRVKCVICLFLFKISRYIEHGDVSNNNGNTQLHYVGEQVKFNEKIK